MKHSGKDEGRQLEDWLDGRLEGEDKAEFEHRLEHDVRLQRELALQQDLDRSLLRSFPVPERPLVALAESIRASEVRVERPRRRVALRLAAAALLLSSGALLAQWWGRDRSAPVEPVVVATVPVPDPPTQRDFAREPAHCQELEPVLRPNLESLYESIVELPAPEVACRRHAERTGDDLEQVLTARYGEELHLDPGAGEALFGPHLSEEWPSATVLSGYPDGPQGLPAVLIAEDDSYHSCCVHAAAPSGSGLNVYTWRVGDVLLTEITPHTEPRFLQYFGVEP